MSYKKFRLETRFQDRKCKIFIANFLKISYSVLSPFPYIAYRTLLNLHLKEKGIA